MRYSNLNQMLIMNFEIVRVYRKYYIEILINEIIN